jgi:hypothetical protein
MVQAGGHTVLHVCSSTGTGSRSLLLQEEPGGAYVLSSTFKVARLLMRDQSPLFSGGGEDTEPVTTRPLCELGYSVSFSMITFNRSHLLAKAGNGNENKTKHINKYGGLHACFVAVARAAYYGSQSSSVGLSADNLVDKPTPSMQLVTWVNKILDSRWSNKK